MPRLPSIFEDENFIRELQGIFNKTAQAAPAPAPAPAPAAGDVQLALDMVNSYSGLPTGQISPGSSVSIPGGVKDENKPGVSDLYSLDAFINYLRKNNFQYGGGAGSSGLTLVTPGKIGPNDVNMRPGSGFVQYTSKNPPGDFIVNKDGLVQVLKEIAAQAGKSGDLYLQELANRLIDDALNSGELQVEKNSFDAEKQQIDPRAAPAAAPAAPAAPGATPTAGKPGAPAGAPGAVPVSDKTTETAVDSQIATMTGANSLDDWLPFYPGQGIADFNDMKFFAEGLAKLVNGNPAIASQLRRFVNAIRANINSIENAEQQFKANAPPDMKYSERIVLSDITDPMAALRDFKEQFPAPSQPGLALTQPGYTLSSQVAVAQSAAVSVSYTLQLLLALTNTQLYDLPDFKDALDAQVVEGQKLNRGLLQLASMIQGQAENMAREARR